MRLLFMLFRLTSLLLISVGVHAQSGMPAELPADFYEKRVQPIFDSRCLACHSCFNAPCQLNLQNFEGFARGANKSNVYQGTRTKSAQPSRMWIDAHTTEAWSQMGFYSVNTSTKLEDNLFYSLLNIRAQNPQRQISKTVEESMMCPDTVASVRSLEKKNPELGMPFGLPPLNKQELQTVAQWLQVGAPVPKERAVRVPSKAVQGEIKDWESFFNKKDDRHRLVSRYMFEHLFLAHLYFTEQPDTFYRLVRSKTECSKGVDEIATRRPNDNPGMKKFYYCFQQFPGSVVMKTHIPYELSEAKRELFEDLFFKPKWKVTALPGYEPGVAENPFKAFHEIPSKLRYQFLLNDAQYHISTFIKGPVCNGSFAVNSIQEQFYVFFLDPQADNMLHSAAYEKSVEGSLMLPGVWGSDINLATAPVLLAQLRDHREAYRKMRAEDFKKFRPEGYALKDIWNGDEENDNAVLTVFRHDDNAVVIKGARGDLSKTAFVLDYPLFERLVYNLVVNFDVFGNVGHQMLTRIYMDMIRMEAEELFLLFLPPEQRLEYRRSWYRGLFAEAKMAYVFPTVGAEDRTAIRYTDPTKTKQQFVEKILFYRLNEKVRGPLDFLNWRELKIPEALNVKPPLTKLDQEIRKISAVKAGNRIPFARFFPDSAYLMIRSDKEVEKVYSLVHNKEHENISWILGESLRMAPKEDSLTVIEGYYAPYPNQFFVVDESQVAAFVKAVTAVKSEKAYKSLVKEFGVLRTSPDFWVHYDDLTRHFLRTDPINFGYLDLTRYQLK